MEYKSETTPGIRREDTYEMRITYNDSAYFNVIDKQMAHIISRVVESFVSYNSVFHAVSFDFKYRNIKGIETFICNVKFSCVHSLTCMAFYLSKCHATVAEIMRSSLSSYGAFQISLGNMREQKTIMLSKNNSNFRFICSPDVIAYKFAAICDYKMTATEQADLFCRTFRLSASTCKPYGMSDTFTASKPGRLINGMTAAINESMMPYGENKVKCGGVVPEPGGYAVCCVYGKSPYYSDGTDRYCIVVFTNIERHVPKHGIPLTLYAGLAHIGMEFDEFKEIAETMTTGSGFMFEHMFIVDRVAKMTGLPDIDAKRYVVQAFERTLKNI